MAPRMRTKTRRENEPAAAERWCAASLRGWRAIDGKKKVSEFGFEVEEATG
jgi:hypothetical protein